MSGDVRNVILIISDTLRRDCVSVYGEPGWFGRPLYTTHLERFAGRATVFERAFSSSFPTVPLRNDLLTGRATFTYKPWAPLDRNDTTLQETLNGHGMVTGLLADEVTLVDRWTGHLLERAESLGLFENTAILFLSDHGFYLGEHGYVGKSLITPRYQQTVPLYPEVCRIPFLVHMPGQETTSRVGALAQPLDLAPT